MFLLYWLAPDVAQVDPLGPSRHGSRDAAVLITFAAMDLLLRFSNPGSAFGAAGSVLILLWSLFLVSAIVIVGGIVNAVLGRRYDRKLRDALRHPEKRPERGEIAVSESTAALIPDPSPLERGEGSRAQPGAPRRRSGVGSEGKRSALSSAG